MRTLQDIHGDKFEFINTVGPYELDNGEMSASLVKQTEYLETLARYETTPDTSIVIFFDFYDESGYRYKMIDPVDVSKLDEFNYLDTETHCDFCYQKKMAYGKFVQFFEFSLYVSSNENMSEFGVMANSLHCEECHEKLLIIVTELLKQSKSDLTASLL